MKVAVADQMAAVSAEKEAVAVEQQIVARLKSEMAAQAESSKQAAAVLKSQVEKTEVALAKAIAVAQEQTSMREQVDVAVKAANIATQVLLHTKY